jgi:glycogen operon protein
VGNFPVGWTEWNGRYRDAIRRFWRGDDGMVSEMATRLAGSSDLYDHSGRRPYASVNFVTCHDGFTLHDLVSYNEKHNEANLEDNRDGESHNASWNCGVEGPTDDPQVLALREQQKRNFLSTLFLSQGVPMLLSGDEMGRTQHGNNNSYCQDNELNWLHWDLAPAQRDLVKFVSYLVGLFRQQPVLMRRRFFQGRRRPEGQAKDVTWFEPNGIEMTDESWHGGEVRGFAVRLLGSEVGETDEAGDPIEGDTLFLVFNPHHDPIPFVLPRHTAEQRWERVLDTSHQRWSERAAQHEGVYMLSSRAVAVFRMVETSVSGDLA